MAPNENGSGSGEPSIQARGAGGDSGSSSGAGPKAVTSPLLGEVTKAREESEAGDKTFRELVAEFNSLHLEHTELGVAHAALTATVDQSHNLIRTYLRERIKAAQELRTLAQEALNRRKK
jgi:hypothetical protein